MRYYLLLARNAPSLSLFTRSLTFSSHENIGDRALRTFLTKFVAIVTVPTEVHRGSHGEKFSGACLRAFSSWTVFFVHGGKYISENVSGHFTALIVMHARNFLNIYAYAFDILLYSRCLLTPRTFDTGIGGNRNWTGLFSIDPKRVPPFVDDGKGITKKEKYRSPRYIERVNPLLFITTAIVIIYNTFSPLDPLRSEFQMSPDEI